MENYNIIDLFAGAGGFSKGFQTAGFNPVFAIQIDQWASQTHKFNHPKTNVYTKDITKISDFKDLIKEDIVGIIGGPPCQAFSLSGQRDPKDPRASLFMNYIQSAKQLKPKFCVMQNVKGILSAKTQKGEKVIDLIYKEFDDANYNVCHYVLNSANYGVPQKRERVFFFAIRKDLPFNKQLLKPDIIQKKITVEQALSDLPQIEAGQGVLQQDYSLIQQNEYQKLMRINSSKVYNHVAMQHSKRVVQRFENIKVGQSIFNVSEQHSARKRGSANQISGKVFKQNNARINPKDQSPTITAGFQSSFIHPYLNRNLTARQGARLMSFPDDYIFKGQRTTMSWEKRLSQYKQIGNSVAPLMAKAIGLKMKYYIDNIDSIKNDDLI